MSSGIIYNQTGEIIRVVTAPPDMLSIQAQEGEFLLIGTADSNTQYINVETLEVVDKPPQPNEYSEFNWQTKQWDDLLSIAITDNIKLVKKLTSQKILSKYPTYYQINAVYDFGADSQEVQTMRTWIDNIRSISNIVEPNINSATSVDQIITIINNFKLELNNIL